MDTSRDVFQTLLARPSQSLITHLINMKEACEALNSTPLRITSTLTKEDNEKLLDDLINIMIVSHDFGKVNPYFQKKLLTKKLHISHETTQKLSYHSQLGAFFCWIFLNEYLESLETKYSQDLREELYVHSLAITYAIFNHHNTKSLPNTIDAGIIETGLDFTYEDLAVIIREMNSYFPSESRIHLRKLQGVNGKDTFHSQQLESVDPLARYFANFFRNSDYLIDILATSIEKLRALNSEEAIQEITDEMCYFWSTYKQDNNLLMFILYYFSLLCDLDEWDAKSHVEDSNTHRILFENTHVNFGNNLVNNYKCNKYPLDEKKLNDPLRKLKEELWQETNKLLEEKDLFEIISVSYPTGSGKTLAYLNLAFEIRDNIYISEGYFPRIIYGLPFISITDQVGTQVDEILQTYASYKKSNGIPQSEFLSIHHNTAEAEWTYIAEEEKEEFNISLAKDFINLWNSNIIVTTFVSFWNSFFGGKKKNYLRFHRIAGSIIILDEIQTLPIRYWQVISTTLHQLCKLFNCTIILGSATYPKAISHPFSWNKTVADITELNYNNEKQILDRYTLNYDSTRISLTDFTVHIAEFINKSDKSILIVLNTRESARLLFDFVSAECTKKEILFLSSAVTYEDRAAVISKIVSRAEKNEKSILICTQVIEAGIDLSFDIVFRDLAPLDSIIQVAGRCNRYNKERGQVKIVELTLPEIKYETYSSQVYDSVTLDQTKRILNKYQELNEKDLQKLIADYYDILSLKGEKKASDEGVHEFTNSLIRSLNRKFYLIEEKNDETLVICETQEDLLKLFQMVDTVKTRNALKEHRRKTINISQKLREKLFAKLKENKAIVEIFPDSNLKIWGIYLTGNEIVYQENGGLNIPYLNNTSNLKNVSE